MRYKKHLLAASIFTALTTMPAIAQQEKPKDEGDVEVIQVSGIRGSLVRSLFDKRFADNIVDGISAEDIGKFPDQNVAESLQRITGVTITRGDSGEGQQISIRGFGPNFSNVLFNGRTMPADNNQRGFRFDLVASELITGADVYKTLKADTLEGGLGGTVNVKTARPFDYDGFKAAASAKGVYDDLAESTNPYFSGIVSQNFDNDFGILASLAYQQRDTRLDKLASGYASSTVFTGPLGSKTETAEKHLRPTTANQIIQRSDRERIGGTLVAQWQITDDILLTGDVLYSMLEDKKDNKVLSNYYGRNKIYNAKFDEFGTVISFDRPAAISVAPGVIQNYKDGKKLPASQSNTLRTDGRDRDSSTRMIGLNLEWNVSDTFNMTFDLQDSKSIARSDNNPLVTMRASTTVPTSYENTGDSLKFSSDEVFNSNHPDRYTVGNIYLFTENRDDDITEFRIDNKWAPEDFEYLTGVKFGAYYSDREKTVTGAQSRWTEAAKAFSGFTVPASIFGKTNIPFLKDHDKGGFVHTWLDFNPYDVFAYFNTPEALASAGFIGEQIMNNFENGQAKKNGDPKYPSREAAQAAADKAVADRVEKIKGYLASAPKDGPYGLYNPVANPAKSWFVSEETMAAYVEASFAGDDWSANFGVRYVSTETESEAAGETFIGTDTITPGSEILSLVKDSGETLHSEGDYSEVLPSMNLKYNLTDDLVARVAYSKSLTRPKLEDLTAAQSIRVSSFSEEQGFEGDLRGKNTELKPFTSTNFDVALEWYYAEESYIGATYFKKDLSDWIVNETQVVVLRDTIQNVDRDFNQTIPRNTESADVDGLEIAMLHNFDSGFGIQANYTYLDTTASAGAKNVSRVSLHGLSENAYNVIGFYETGPFKVRVAYNWRDSYTLCAECIDTRGVNSERTVDDYGQVDVSASYRLSKNISFNIAAVNLTDEDPYQYTIRESNLLSISDTGTRYTLGVRAKF